MEDELNDLQFRGSARNLLTAISYFENAQAQKELQSLSLVVLDRFYRFN